MNRSQTRGVVRTLLCGLAVVLAAGPLRADDNISFKRRGDEEKKFVTAVGTAIVKAAHATSKKQALVKHEYTNPKPGRTELIVKMEFYGAVSGKKYIADIVVKIDSTKKDAWEVLNIDYSDNDTVPYNEKKIQELIKKMNE